MKKYKVKGFLNSNDWYRESWKRLEKEGVKTGHRGKGGHSNGYAIIEKDQPCFNMDYNDVKVNVHGGLTFGRLLTIGDFMHYKDVTLEDVGKYMLGFDTLHYNDDMTNCNKEYCQKELESLIKQLEEYES